MQASGNGTGEGPVAVVAEARWVWPAVWVAFPLLGAAGLVLLVRAADWVFSLPFIPGPLALLASLPEPAVSIGALVLGLVGGAAVAAHAQRDSLVVAVSATTLTLRRGKHTAREPRDAVGAVFLDGKELVVLGRGGEERQRWPSDRSAEELGRALTAYGYPWHRDGDPYRDDYRRWVPDLPGLPDGAPALLAARERALARDDHTDAAQLRTELARLGLAVRQEGTRQFWRRVGT